MDPATLPQAPSTPRQSKNGKVSKERSPLTAYGIPEGGLAEWPTDFDKKKHRPLRRKDFADETIYLFKMAERHDEAAARLRKEAADYTTLGGVKDRGAAKRLLKMQAKLIELKKQLAGDNIDVEAILASLNV